MNQNVGFHIRPSFGAMGLAKLWWPYHDDPWPARWAGLERAAREARALVEAETDTLMRLLERLGRSAGVRIERRGERWFDEGTSLIGLFDYMVRLDLRAVLAGDRASETLRVAWELLGFVQQADSYEANTLRETHGCITGVERVLAAIAAAALARGIDLDDAAPVGMQPDLGVDRRRIPPTPPAELTENETFFLTFNALKWPVTPGRLAEAYEYVCRSAEPAEDCNDPFARVRYSRLCNGYFELKERLEPPVVDHDDEEAVAPD